MTGRYTDSRSNRCCSTTMCRRGGDRAQGLAGAGRTVEHDDLDLVVQQQVERESLLLVRRLQTPHRREALEQVQLPRAALARAPNWCPSATQRRCSPRGRSRRHLLDGHLMGVKQRVDDRDLSVECDPPVRAGRSAGARSSGLCSTAARPTAAAVNRNAVSLDTTSTGPPSGDAIARPSAVPTILLSGVSADSP